MSGAPAPAPALLSALTLALPPPPCAGARLASPTAPQSGTPPGRPTRGLRGEVGAAVLPLAELSSRSCRTGRDGCTASAGDWGGESDARAGSRAGLPLDAPDVAVALLDWRTRTTSSRRDESARSYLGRAHPSSGAAPVGEKVALAGLSTRVPARRQPSASSSASGGRGDDGLELPPSCTGEGSGSRLDDAVPSPLRRLQLGRPPCIPGRSATLKSSRALPLPSGLAVGGWPWCGCGRVGLCALLGTLTPYAPRALIPRVTIRGTVGPRWGLRIGTAWTEDVERTELAREMPVVVVCEVEDDEMLVSESELLVGPPPPGLCDPPELDGFEMGVRGVRPPTAVPPAPAWPWPCAWWR